MRNLHLELLTGAGYEAMAVADGALAWDAIQTQHFDLMITDNSMPKVTGVELMNKLIAANIRLPVIMVTGALPQHEFIRNVWLNNIAVLEKPVSNSTLLSTVEKVLNEGKVIPNNKIDPTELAATMIESPPPAIVSKEERTDKAEARSDEAANACLRRLRMGPLRDDCAGEGAERPRIGALQSERRREPGVRIVVPPMSQMRISGQ